MIRGCGRTDFQEGDPNVLYHSINDKIFALPDDTRLFPDMTTMVLLSSVAEENNLTQTFT